MASNAWLPIGRLSTKLCSNLIGATHPLTKLTTMTKTYTDKLTALSAVIYNKLGPGYHEDFWALIREIEKTTATATAGKR